MPDIARISLLVALALALVTAPIASAQTLEDQAEAVEAHAMGEVDDAGDNAVAYGFNATNASWQGEQANWTVTWTCDTASAVHEEARKALVEAGACPEAEDAAAGQAEQDEEDEGKNQSQAQADELGNDTGAAVDDQVAATEALVNDTTQDPANATDHVAEFVNRTRAVLERLLGLPMAGIEAGVGLVMDVAGIAGEAGAATVDGTKATSKVLVDGLMAVVDATDDGLGATVDAAERFLDASANAIGAFGGHMAGTVEDAVTATAHAVEHGAEAMADALVETAQAAMDAIRDLVPGGDEDAKGPTVDDPVGGLTGEGQVPGLELPVEV